MMPTSSRLNDEHRKIDGYSVVDLRGGVDFGRFSVEAYAKNLFDADGRTSTVGPTANGAPIYPNGALGTGIIRPRTIGISLTAGSMIRWERRGRSSRPIGATAARTRLPRSDRICYSSAIRLSGAMPRPPLGLRDWAPERCIGELVLPGATVTTGIPRLRPVEAYAMGARALADRCCQPGGVNPTALGARPCWKRLAPGWILLSGMHSRLSDIPQLAAAAKALGRRLVDVRVPPEQYSDRAPAGSAAASGCSRSAPIARWARNIPRCRSLADFRARGLDATFRATGQTGIMIAGSGIPIDAVVSDFIAGAAEMLTPAARRDHIDVIEGQGSLFHPAYAAVSLGLLHGSQPDMFIVCHEPGRTHVLGYPDFQLADDRGSHRPDDCAGPADQSGHSLRRRQSQHFGPCRR